MVPYHPKCSRGYPAYPRFLVAFGQIVETYEVQPIHILRPQLSGPSAKRKYWSFAEQHTMISLHVKGMRPVCRGNPFKWQEALAFGVNKNEL